MEGDVKMKCCGNENEEKGTKEHAEHSAHAGAKNMAVDPICKMTVDESTAEWTSEYKGKMYYFCASGCKSSFEENPEKYLMEGPAPAPANAHKKSHSCCGGGDEHSGDKKAWWKFW